MDKRKFKILAATVLLLINCGLASATTIDDNYWGATPTDAVPRDIVGAEGNYDVSKIEATQIGDTIYLDIYSRFLNDIQLRNNESFQNLLLGDLFISTDGWDPNGTSTYNDDNASTGTAWEYALALDEHTYNRSAGGLNTGGNAFLYKISDGDTILESDDFFGPGDTYRTGQEVQFSPADDSSLIRTNLWSIGYGTSSDDFDDYLSLSFSLADLGISTGQELGFHWTMTCGNDVIEGALTPVPEPATMLLFGTGIIGLAGFVRRRNKK